MKNNDCRQTCPHNWIKLAITFCNVPLLILKKKYVDGVLLTYTVLHELSCHHFMKIWAILTKVPGKTTEHKTAAVNKKKQTICIHWEIPQTEKHRLLFCLKNHTPNTLFFKWFSSIQISSQGQVEQFFWHSILYINRTWKYYFFSLGIVPIRNKSHVQGLFFSMWERCWCFIGS